MTAPALEVHGLRAGYGGRDVLRGVDLVVPAGLTAILGPSGCGKTTLLRVVAGFVAPSAGSVAVAGATVAGGGRAVPPRRRGVGYVPQEGALFPHLDVAANVAFGLPRGERRGHRVTEVLDLVELPRDLVARYPHELSGGQQQRVALARALAPAPALVLLDEPFSSLDAGLREDTGRSVARALAAAGTAALLVTHDQGEALSLADQVAVMHDGAFLQVASPAAVYLDPADARVAEFVGHVSMLPGTVVGGPDGTEVHCALGVLPLREKPGRGAVRVAVRAEQLQVRTEAGRGVPAVVEEVSYFGHDATSRVRLASGELVAARTPAAGVPEVGARVFVQVDGDVVAFLVEDGPA